MLISDVFVAVTVMVRLAIVNLHVNERLFWCLHENCVGCGSWRVKRKNIPSHQPK